jgi:hypothetical protein
VYEVSAGAWTLRKSTNFTITSGTEFIMRATVTAGKAGGYNGTTVAGQVGLWCSDGSNNSVDFFRVHDAGGFYTAAAGWMGKMGDAGIASGTFTSSTTDDNLANEQAFLYLPFRGEKYRAEFDFVYKEDPNDPAFAGCAIHAQDFTNHMGVVVSKSTQKVQLFKRVDGNATVVATADFALSLTAGQTYGMQVVIDDAPGNPALQQITVKIDTDQDGLFTPDTPHARIVSARWKNPGGTQISALSVSVGESMGPIISGAD